VELLLSVEVVDSRFVLSFFIPAELILWNCGSGAGEEASGGGNSPPDSDPFSDTEFGEDLVRLSSQFAVSAKRRFQFQKRGQLFICTHNKTLSVVVMCVSNEDCFPVGMCG
jgi:hypothetical protein